MLSRCEDEDNPQYYNYGGRGIAVCDEWHDFNNFYNWCIESGIEADLQIDRIDNDKGYQPDNCRLVTRKQNARNKRTNRLLTAFGETKSVTEWSEDHRCMISPGGIMHRIKSGMSVEDAILAPPKPNASEGKSASNALQYEAFGESKSIHQWSYDERCVVGQKTLSHRIHSGWDIERALTSQQGWQKGKEYEGHNISYWANDPRCIVSYNTLTRRLTRGWSIERALTTPPRNKT